MPQPGTARVHMSKVSEEPMSTTATLLVPVDRRDRANGLVGSILGLSYLVTR